MTERDLHDFLVDRCSGKDEFNFWWDFYLALWWRFAAGHAGPLELNSGTSE